MVNVAVMGYGVVGSGVVEVLEMNRSIISLRSNTKITVKKILDIREFPNDSYKHLITKDIDDILNDDSINIVIETIGGIGIAYEFTKKCILKGKHVVTSNKELVATYGREILKMAKDNNVSYLFEASVGGGIPVIRPLNICLEANEILEINGILNGTTNYILTQMKKEGKDFAEALKSAQHKGYAEFNPTCDIEGYDTGRKIAILSSIAFGSFVNYQKIDTKGISGITLKDLMYADKLDSEIKLLATAKKNQHKIYIKVRPVILNKHHLLAKVEDVFNAVLIKGNVVGDCMFYGRGAGKLPTASAVVADVMDIVKNKPNHPKCLWNLDNEIDISDSDNLSVRNFVRLKTSNASLAKKYADGLFENIEPIGLDCNMDEEFAFISPLMIQKKFRVLLDRLCKNGYVDKVLSIIEIFEH